MSSIKLFVLFLLAFSHVSKQDGQFENEIIKIQPKGPIYRGALIEDYKNEVLIIKLTSPSDIIKRVLAKIDAKATPAQVYTDMVVSLGYLDKIFSLRFNEILVTYSLSLSSHRPISGVISPDLQVTHRRSKRQALRFILTLLRAVRPVARVGGKLTKYGKFWKALKYTSYAASAGLLSYEIAGILGAVPDVKYDYLIAEIDKLHEARTNDISYMKNLTLATTQLSEVINDIYMELTQVIGEARSVFEVQLQGSILFSSYMTSITNALTLLATKIIPTTLMSLDTQRSWLEKKLPSALLNSVGSISPHLPVTLENIDTEKGLLLLKVEVPIIDTRFQLLNYIEWEPRFFSKEKCYSSPVPMLYLAYPIYRGVPLNENPLIIDPRSCLSDGFIMCESDSLLNSIPDVSENTLCTKHKALNSRHKREADDLYFEAQTPEYDMSAVVKRTMIEKEGPKIIQTNLSELLEKISKMEIEAKQERFDSSERLKKAKSDQDIINILVYVLSTVISLIVIIVLKSFWDKIKEKRQAKSISDLENARMEAILSLQK